jgi:hypothetical protein
MVSMSKEILLNHVAVECVDQQSADLFFMTILGMKKIKSTQLSKELSAAIFMIDSPVAFQSYDNGNMRIEVFIHTSKQGSSFRHLCLEVENKNDFIARCTHHGLKPFFVEKDGKQLLFVRDFSENLYEIKYPL